MKKFAKRAKYAVALAIAGVMSLSVCPVGAFAEGDDVNVTLKNYYTSDYDNYDDLLADGDKLEHELYG